MSNPRARGCLTFVLLIVVVVGLCGLIPFVVMPAAGIAVALPIITVPGEVVTPGGLFGVDLTNTIIGTFLSSIVVVVIALLAYRASRGWTKEVPGRFQGMIEVLSEGLYGFLKGLGGDRLRTTPFLWPLVATIFLFLLTANMLKMFPGVETIGNLHCAHVGYNGYPVLPSGGSSLLYVNAPMDAGTPQTEETEHACHEYFVGNVSRFDIAGFETTEDAIAELESQRSALEASLASATGDATVAIEEGIAVIDDRIASAQAIEELTPRIDTLNARIAELKAAPADDGHGEAAEAVDNSAAIAEAETELSALTTSLNLAHSQLQYPHATLALTPDDLAKGAVPYIFHITPFVRGAATDLSLTIAYAVMTVVIVQVYGVWALGPAYFEKFINLTALGNISKRPLGAVDFLVGLFEIISEIGKIISLAFRLFGNLFAGGVALIAIAFLIAMLVPGVIFLLELVIGTVQALVFAVLTLVFVVQAMEHHGGDHDDHHAEAEHH